MRRRHAPLEQHPEILQHPVAAFRLIQRLTSDWERVTRVTRKAKSQNEMGFIESEYPKVTRAFVRLYLLNTCLKLDQDLKYREMWRIKKNDYIFFFEKKIFGNSKGNDIDVVSTSRRFVQL